MLKNSYLEEDLQKCYSIYGFFSEKAGIKNDASYGYILTTAFFCALKEFYGEKVGVMYSSSMTDNQGLNVALSRELIDADNLKLEQAIMFKCRRNPGNGKKFNIFPCSNPAFPDADGNLNFSGII